MNRSVFFLIMLLVCNFSTTVEVKAQISAYTNFQNQFVVWDDGMIRRIEYLLPLKMDIGRIAIPYLDNSRSFKIYHNGASVKINDGGTANFQATDYLVTYQNAKSLWVWEKGETTMLSAYSEQFFVADSIVLYYDGVSKQFNAYYNKKIYPIEGFIAASSGVEHFFSTDDNKVSTDMQIASGQLTSAKASDNIAAYINYANQFKIFYRGRIIDEDYYPVESFAVGRNTVAYVDANQYFKVFHHGKTRLVDEFKPYSYAVGDDIVAFVGADNYFKILYDDSVYSIAYIDPRYEVKDNIVAFEDETGFLSVFYKGKVYRLENFYPEKIAISYNSLAYVNRANVLKLFSEGTIYEVTNADLAHWRLDYDVIQYRFGGNMYKIFHKGKTY